MRAPAPAADDADEHAVTPARAGRRPWIDQQSIVAAALAVARRVGLRELSMRMVATELGVSPMAAYRHVPNREALVALVADQLLAAVPVPPRSAGSWDARLRQLERSAFRAAASVPGQSDVTVLASGPHQRRLADGVMAILTDAGFGEEDAAVAFEVIWAYFQGQLRVYEGLTTPAGPADHGATPALWPGLAQVVEGVPSLSPVDFFERGFEILLDGLRARLSTPTSPTSHSSPTPARPGRPGRPGRPASDPANKSRILGAGWGAEVGW